MSDYKNVFDEDGDQLGCGSCSSQAPLSEFMDEWLCVFCANVVGRSGDHADKQMLSMAMNTLVKVLKDQNGHRDN